MKEITDKQFETIVKEILPDYVMMNGMPYALMCHKRWHGGYSVGGYSIAYKNESLKHPQNFAFVETWNDPFDCIKAVFHKLYNDPSMSNVFRDIDINLANIQVNNSITHHLENAS